MEKFKTDLNDKPIEPLKRKKSLIISPKKIVLIIFVLFLVLVILYFWRELNFLIKPPSLIIIQPPTDITSTEETFKIIGKTEPGVYLTINKDEIYVDKEGNFEEEINLSQGINLIEIIVKNRFNKTNKEIRRIIYNQQNYE